MRARSKVVAAEEWKKHEDPEMCFHYLMEKFETFRTTHVSMSEWGNKKDIEFVYDVGWPHSVCPVEDIRRVDGEAIVEMRMPCFRDCQIKGGVQIGSPNYIENAFELLDTPGEWHLDRGRGVLYCIPLPETVLNNSNTMIPVAERLLVIQANLYKDPNFSVYLCCN